MSLPLSDRLAVCSWSLQPKDPGQLIQQLQSLNLPRVQLALDPVRTEPAVWGAVSDQFAKAGLQIVSGMFGTVGEDYTTLDSIRRTGGLVPDIHWEENWRNIQEIVRIAKAMNIRLVGFHAGFLPHDPADPDFEKLLKRVRQVAELFAAHQIDLAFETGQETAEVLKSFLQLLHMPNVGVNFDPANMILYDKGDPIAALRELGPFLKQCHIKDANRTLQPGTWGEEVVVGTGQVDWKAFFLTLKQLGFDGNCALEREAGSQRLADLAAGRDTVLRFSREIGY